jgi:GT2 family glycosyltransferase
MSGGPEVSVVVATHDRAQRLGLLLDALRTQSLETERFEVIVVDDASPPDTRTLLNRELERGGLPLRVLRRDSNGGRAQAREDGWRTATSGLIAFTDDDCEPDTHWLERGLEACGREPGAIVQGRTEPNPRDLASIEPRGRPFSRTIQVSEHDVGYPTCNIFYPRELLEQIGGFDTDAFGRVHGGEDADLAWRAIESGAPATFAPEALVHHAVAQLTPFGKLRVAGSWEMKAVVRHPELRRALFFRGPFWKLSHYLLARALLALVLPRRLLPLRIWLAAPYAVQLLQRGRAEGGGPLLAPYYVLHDLVEVSAVVRGAIKYRSPMV